jgi:hypothetical protein
MAISPKLTSGQLPEPASGVGRYSTADESHAKPDAPITDVSRQFPIVFHQQNAHVRISHKQLLSDGPGQTVGSLSLCDATGRGATVLNPCMKLPRQAERKLKPRGRH